MGCQAGVESANLTTVMNTDNTTSTKSYDTIKLGIDAHAKWYYVARQLDGATPQAAGRERQQERQTELGSVYLTDGDRVKGYVMTPYS